MYRGGLATLGLFCGILMVATPSSSHFVWSSSSLSFDFRFLESLHELYSSHVKSHTSHVKSHTSHVTRHTSHVTRHTLHLAPIPGQFMSTATASLKGIISIAAGADLLAGHVPLYTMLRLSFSLHDLPPPLLFCSGDGRRGRRVCGIICYGW